MAGKNKCNAGSELARVESWRAIEGRLIHMDHLARNEDWESLVNEQEAYVVAVSDMADHEHGIELDLVEQQVCHDILRRIVELEQGIRERLESRRDELGRYMEATRRERELARSYGALKRARAGGGPRQ